jgi:competence protein ComEA
MILDSWTIRLLLAAGLWAPQPAAAQSSEPAARLDINHATAEDFARLAGIGPARAAAVIRIRERNGPFRSVEELRALPRLPEKVFQQLRDQVTVIANPASVRARNHPAQLDPARKTSEKQQSNNN